MNIIAIIQARFDSVRLPGKILLNLEGKTVLERVVERVKQSKFINDVIVATTVTKHDLETIKVCVENNIRVFAGAEDDVLDRYYQVAKLFKVDHIVRITADCPLIDPRIIDEVINLHIKETADYTTNTIKESFPDGQDVEVFKFSVLQQAWQNAKLVSEREHVTPYIRNNPGIFKLKNLECKEDLSRKRWTLDHPEDYDFIKIVYEHLFSKNPYFGFDEIMGFIKKNPEIEKVNQRITRNEGYSKSLKEDRVLDFELPKGE